MSRPIITSPATHPDRLWLHLPPPAVKPLRDHGSLTAMVRRVSEDFGVRVTAQGWSRPFADERHLLGGGRQAWCREVLLGDADVPLVFAHTVVAAGDLGHWPWLRGLGGRPLGAVLFAHPRVFRLPLRFRQIDARHPLYHSARRASACAARELWARRSLFRLDGRDLLVTEVFLPTLFDRLRRA